ncbi:Antibiotic biosynthesis monooxygenase [anaerobic digester metagenome]
MIKVVAKHFIEESRINDFLEHAAELVESSLKEDGCISYGLYQDVKDSEVVAMIEEWEDRDSLEDHMASEHFKRIVPSLNEFYEKEGEINVYRKI